MTELFTRSTLLRIVLCSLVVSLCGCETTGDPEKGGLFGWSRQKAEDRRQELEQADARAQSQLSTEQARKQTLQGTQNKLTQDANHLQGEVNRLMAENTDLESQLTNLLGRMKLGATELKRLNGVLSENKRLRQQLGTGPAGAATSAVPDALNQQNQKLQREVLALLGR